MRMETFSFFYQIYNFLHSSLSTRLIFGIIDYNEFGYTSSEKRR